LDLRTPKLADGHSFGPHPQLPVPRPCDSSPTPTARFFSRDSESPSVDFWKLSVAARSAQPSRAQQQQWPNSTQQARSAQYDPAAQFGLLPSSPTCLAKFSLFTNLPLFFSNK
ncbi:hypothetical protein CRG98_049943, partial [Punica granatum]